jgi:uncharacterized membrane protein
VSADGKYVAGEASGTDGTLAVRFADTDSMILGTMATWQASHAWGISDDGSVVVGHADTLVGAAAFRWSGELEELPPLVRAGVYAQAAAVSGDGTVVVGQSESATAETLPVQWIGGTAQELPRPEGFVSAYPVDVSVDGSSIAGWGYNSEADEAIRWPAMGVVPLGLTWGKATSVSRDGRYIVGYYDPAEGAPGAPELRVFRYRAGYEPDILPPPVDGAVACSHAAVNGDGAIVVGRCTGYTATPGTFLFLWSEATGAVLLEDVLSRLGVDTSLYTFLDLVDVSADGNAIIGNATRAGEPIGWRALVGEVFP